MVNNLQEDLKSILFEISRSRVSKYTASEAKDTKSNIPKNTKAEVEDQSSQKLLAAMELAKVQGQHKKYKTISTTMIDKINQLKREVIRIKADKVEKFEEENRALRNKALDAKAQVVDLQRVIRNRKEQIPNPGRDVEKALGLLRAMHDGAVKQRKEMSKKSKRAREHGGEGASAPPKRLKK